jgi:CheY-like chemotaxis protein
MDSQALRNELPFLRRYARGMTGSQRSGDSIVRQVLESVLHDPLLIDPAEPIRIELYKLFQKVWQSCFSHSGSIPRVTGGLENRPRQTLFLSAVEGFSVAEIAHILTIDADEVNADIAKARSYIDSQLRANILVIEDEAIVAMHIRSIVEEQGHVCVGTARTHREAVSLAQSLKPELILADISLADGSSGIDAVKDILEDHDVPVIFVTAYPERLLTGERPEPTFLLTKPFDPPSLVATIAQALFLDREGEGDGANAAADAAAVQMVH